MYFGIQIKCEWDVHTLRGKDEDCIFELSDKDCQENRDSEATKKKDQVFNDSMLRQVQCLRWIGFGSFKYCTKEVLLFLEGQDREQIVWERLYLIEKLWKSW